MWAILQSLIHFTPTLSSNHISKLLLRSDNSTSVFNINRWHAGTNLRRLLTKIWRHMKAMKVQMKAQLIPGKKNGRADSLSRLERGGDYQIRQEAFRELVKKIQVKITLDAFATAWNKKAYRWCGPRSHINEDGLQQPWYGETVLAHPPIPLILPTIRKTILEQARVLLLLPDWKGQIWEPLLRETNHVEWTSKNLSDLLIPGPLMKKMDACLPPGKLRAILINP
ncbi:uncharacterized protein MONOS_6143fu14596 [Monocercomonoides exilis]|uniref:uncharacterized protein n=1 Tax=Monocercomonoides exilis TaxID=2049356 RepID=UPI00355A82B6|nr:hypothetical protein MONOS_6143fu14596 [Monocercomonoides exilis]|eukprot:MONOS_6143.1-p1 / transcript=MONOS_6143.1 / gene=MONOS_6143 / organism=Monocercomonoides_exilis_PA203 / gene_product=unspecified product / transcript_product=unspecified product / location=Mono_scaffold00189:75246-75920(-) / protein_length=225 / sequence_SO=supercontig / SO=protein_coding / is_pseudo=false